MSSEPPRPPLAIYKRTRRRTSRRSTSQAVIVVVVLALVVARDLFEDFEREPPRNPGKPVNDRQKVSLCLWVCV